MKKPISKIILGMANLLIFFSLSLNGCGQGGDGFLEPGTIGPGLGPYNYSDGVPPTVLATRPETDDNGVKINSVVSADFNEFINPSTLSKTTFLLKDNANNTVPGSVTCSGMSATFTPDSYLSTSTVYTATITNGVTDASGTHMAGSYSWSFTTSSSSDVIPPAIVSRSPTLNEGDVKVYSAVTVTFSEPIDTCTSGALTLRDRNMYTLINGDVNCSGSSAVFTPAQDLSQKTGYTACIWTSVTDLAGNPLAQGSCWDFWTGFANSEMFEPYISIPVGSDPEAVAIGDVTGDGKNDVVMVTWYNEYKLYIFAQNSSGGLSSAAIYNTTGTYSYSPNTVAIGDINNDGKNEVVVGNSGKNIEVFVQNGEGGLVSNATYTTYSSSLIRIADLNHDGLSDVVGIAWGSDAADVFLQNANGTLDTPVTYSVNHSGWDDLETGDVNNDGLIDIIVMSGGGLPQTIGVLTQKADGTFNTAVYYTPAGSSIGVGDVNGDGLNDIVGRYGGVCVFTQNNLGTLNPSTCHSSYNGGGPIEVADVTGDGRMDIILTHYGYSALGIYIQNADGSLSPEELYAIPYGVYNPHALAIGDINSDGINEVVTLDRYYGLIVLYKK